MKNKFIFDILSNPDMITYSSKRAGGFISLFATIGFGIFNFSNSMTVMAGLTVAFFGLASLDYKTQLDTDPKPIDPDTGNTPINP